MPLVAPHALGRCSKQRNVIVAVVRKKRAIDEIIVDYDRYNYEPELSVMDKLFNDSS